MNEQIYSDINFEKFLQSHFGVDFEICKVIARDLPAGRTAEAVIFMTKKKRVYVFISAEAKHLLGDVQKILSKMGLKVSEFIPPNGVRDYFEDRARVKVLEVFPGRMQISDDDLRFYKTLIPYNPALAEVSEIRNGEIKEFNADTRGNWRVAKRFSYKRIIAKNV